MRSVSRRFTHLAFLCVCLAALVVPAWVAPSPVRGNDRGTFGSFHELYHRSDTMIAADAVDIDTKTLHAKITTVYWGRYKVGDTVAVSLEGVWLKRPKPGTKLLMLGKAGEQEFTLACGEQGLLEAPSAALIEYYTKYREAELAEVAHPETPAIVPLLMQGLESTDTKILVEAAWDLRSLASRTKLEARATLWTGPQQAQVLKRVKDLVEHSAEQTDEQHEQKQLLMQAAYCVCGNTPELRVMLWQATQCTDEKYRGLVIDAVQLLAEAPAASETDRFIALSKEGAASMSAVNALVALMRIGTPAARAALIEIRDTAADPLMRKNAQNLLDEIHPVTAPVPVPEPLQK